MRGSIRVLWLAMPRDWRSLQSTSPFAHACGGTHFGRPRPDHHWGFTFANSGYDFAIVTSATCLNDPTQGSVVGALADFISQFQFVMAVRAAARFTQPFSLNNQQGGRLVSH